MLIAEHAHYGKYTIRKPLKWSRFATILYTLGISRCNYYSFGYRMDLIMVTEALLGRIGVGTTIGALRPRPRPSGGCKDPDATHQRLHRRNYLPFSPSRRRNESRNKRLASRASPGLT